MLSRWWGIKTNPQRCSRSKSHCGWTYLGQSRCLSLLHQTVNMWPKWCCRELQIDKRKETREWEEEGGSDGDTEAMKESKREGRDSCFPLLLSGDVFIQSQLKFVHIHSGSRPATPLSISLLLSLVLFPRSVLGLICFSFLESRCCSYTTVSSLS